MKIDRWMGPALDENFDIDRQDSDYLMSLPGPRAECCLEMEDVHFRLVIAILPSSNNVPPCVSG
jgi:hypothetical protein